MNNAPCYCCDRVGYLFDDSRCSDCTRMTPDEVTGSNPPDDHFA